MLEEPPRDVLGQNLFDGDWVYIEEPIKYSGKNAPVCVQRARVSIPLGGVSSYWSEALNCYLIRVYLENHPASCYFRGTCRMVKVRYCA